MQLSAGENLSMESKAAADMKAQKTTIASDTSLKLDANADVAVTSKAGTKITSTAAIQVKGAMIDLN
jgi:hypothetical protein